MSPGAALIALELFSPEAASPARNSRPTLWVTLLLAALLALAPRAQAAALDAEHVELNVYIDAPAHIFYAQARLLLRNRGGESLRSLELEFPAPLGGRTQVRAVWDRPGELAWRLGPAEENAPRMLLVALRSPLPPGEKWVGVVSYEVNLENFAAPGAALDVSPRSARLATTGWYPLPASSDPAVPRTLRLAVRLPKQWWVTAPVELKKLRTGTTLASYELELESVLPGQLLLHAGSGLPP